MNTSLKTTVLPVSPVPALPDHLWLRVEQARYRQWRRQRIARSGMAAMAALALIAGTTWLSIRPMTQPAAPILANLTPDTRENRQLSLRALDRELQAAYARNASDIELRMLWEQRQALLDPRPDSAAHPLKI